MDLASKKNPTNMASNTIPFNPNRIEPIPKPKSPRVHQKQVAPFSFKLGDNVPRNPHLDPKKMDPLMRPESRSSTVKHQTTKSPEHLTTTRGTNETDSKVKADPIHNDLFNVPKNPHFDPKKINHHIQTNHTTPRWTNEIDLKFSADSPSSDSLPGTSTAPLKPHTGGDVRWDAINSVASRGTQMGLDNFRPLKRLGYGDIGSVYLAELRGTSTFFAMKVMDKASLASRNKLLRAQTEREILSLLDHPFLPTLYSYFETEKFYCLVMEFCSGGNLHSLRQKQPCRRFTEEATRFYASEVLLALEYLHMLGVVYRDLKPENVLVRDQGHIMLSDFDLSLRCSFNPTLVKSSSVGGSGGMLNEETAVQGCMQPSGFLPRLLPSKKSRKAKSDSGIGAGMTMPELMAEPTDVRSMSFVGTHEYLAPEIIRGEGHGSAVDWWTFGIFLYELLHGTTPFKGEGNRATLHNVVGQPLKFPENPQVSSAARDLIRGLLVKEPHRRIAYTRGATEIKQHPFFDGVNWALVRSASPPHVPDPLPSSNNNRPSPSPHPPLFTCASGGPTDDTAYVDFEYF